VVQLAECLICQHLLCNKSMKPWVQTPVPQKKKKRKKEKTNHGIWLSTEKNPKLSSSNVLELIFESSKRMWQQNKHTESNSF
jgi:hypothetical protein